jgi:hypothetical protein
MKLPFQKLPDTMKPEAAAALLAGKTWFHWGQETEHPGDDELKRWIPASAGNVATDHVLRIVDAPESRMTRKQKRMVVDAALEANPQATNREIARLTATSHTFVAIRRFATTPQLQSSFD